MVIMNDLEIINTFILCDLFVKVRNIMQQTEGSFKVCPPMYKEHVYHDGCIKQSQSSSFSC